MELHIDYERWRDKDLIGEFPTGIPVRAKAPDGSWVSADIFYLYSESLFNWLRSRGGANAWAENVVGILLNHGHIVPGDAPTKMPESEQS